MRLKCDFAFVLPHISLLLFQYSIKTVYTCCISASNRQIRYTKEARCERWKYCRSRRTSSPAESVLVRAPSSWKLLAGACILHRGESIQRCTHVSLGSTGLYRRLCCFWGDTEDIRVEETTFNLFIKWHSKEITHGLYIVVLKSDG